jgi:hypothetical protein
MPAPSKLDQFFSAEDQAKLARFIRENPTISVDDFRDLLADKGLEVGRSTAHEYKRKMERIGETMRHAHMIADSMATDLDQAENDGRRHRAGIEMVCAMMLNCQAQLANGDPEGISLKDFTLLSKAWRDLMHSIRLSQDSAIKGRELFAKEASEKLDAGVASGEIDPEAAARARRIMGFT